MRGKEGAYRFLTSLSDYLNEHLPGPEATRDEVNRRSKAPEKPPHDRLACRENLFFYPFALPLIVDYMEEKMGMERKLVIQSLRGEYFKKFPHFLSANARRIEGHPLDKKYGKKIEHIIADWKKPPGREPLYRAHPDLCFSTPFPYKIVCDAKFFDDDSLNSAERALVEGVYETVFYRGLPTCSPTSKWNYDFGCLIAYDASDASSLLQTWNSITSKRLFWEDANIFVMILRGRRGHIRSGF